MHYEPLETTLEAYGYLGSGVPRLQAQHALEQVTGCLHGLTRHGDHAKWQQALDELPEVTATTLELAANVIVIGKAEQCDPETLVALNATLQALRPWRKGPFSVFGIELDAEWRSYMKWQRVADAIGSLSGQRVLDVGSGNGYYCLRALGAGAERVLGVDPSTLFVLQFEALTRLLPPLPVAVLPLRLEDLPDHPEGFDTVLSMGVLYHRRAPRKHLRRLYQLTRAAGQLVLETLVVDGSLDLQPNGRYANMNNVWCIPSIASLLGWTSEAGFDNARVVSVTRTSPEEQRVTGWTSSRSLQHGLNPTDPSVTLEGHPAPTRALLVATRSG